MKDLFASSGRLHTLPWETKFTYTLFMLLNLFGYTVMGTLIVMRTGVSSSELTEYYVGNEAKVERGEEVDEFQPGKSGQELLDVSHFHLFSIPLLLFIQGHVFMMCGWRRKLKASITVAGFIGGAIQIAGPAMVAYEYPFSVYYIHLGRALLTICFLIFTVVPLLSMWGAPKFRPLVKLAGSEKGTYRVGSVASPKLYKKQ